MTNYPGINYAVNQPINQDTDTGIRYGVISQNDLMSEALQDVFDNGADMDFENYQAEVKGNLRNALSDVFSERGGVKGESPLDRAVESAFDAIADEINERYEGTGDCTRMFYEQDGYRIQTDSGGDAWCTKSLYFTYAQFCSPCAPGACHLGNPLDAKLRDNRAYCFGHEWFEDSIAPYPVYLVSTGELVSHLTPATTQAQIA